MRQPMSDATASALQLTTTRIEAALAKSPAFKRIEPRFYLVRQGSAYVYIHVLPWEPGRAVVRLVAQLARGVEMTPDLAIKLLRLNARLRFGAFGFVAQGACVVFSHSLLGGDRLDMEELIIVLGDLAMVADDFDDRIVEEAGGERMQDLIDASAASKLFAEIGPPGAWE